MLKLFVSCGCGACSRVLAELSPAAAGVDVMDVGQVDGLTEAAMCGVADGPFPVLVDSDGAVMRGAEIGKRLGLGGSEE